jgi:transposase
LLLFLVMSQSSPLKPALESLRDQPDQLIEIILRQAGVIEELRMEIQNLKDQLKDLNDRNDGLSAKVEALEQKAARQAAPFRIREQQRKADPQKPGRKAAHAGSCRSVPEVVDEEIMVPLAACPECGQKVGACRPVVQYLEELPEVRPRVVKLITQEAHCAKCGKAVRSTHPLQVSLAQGAAGVQLGARVLGLAAMLNKQHGLTVRKTCAVFKDLFGLRVSPGGLSQALARLAGKLEPAYEKLVARLRDGPYVHTDETSWWVGGPGHWLWVFADRTSTVYRVAKGRGRQVLEGTLGNAFAGVLVSDCLATYDNFNPLQQKCYSHHLKAIGHAMEDSPSPWLEEMRWLLQAAMNLKRQPTDMAQRTALEQKLNELLARPRPTNVEEKVRRRLEKQKDHLFTFLDHPQVDATNNLAERQLRPAVIARKLSCGNKTPAGARTWEILASLASTCAQRQESFAKLISQSALLNHPR